MASRYGLEEKRQTLGMSYKDDNFQRGERVVIQLGSNNVIVLNYAVLEEKLIVST